MKTEALVEYFSTYGIFGIYAVLFSIIFAESGLLIGFFLPGDSLLFTAGFLASKGLFGLNIYVLIPGFFIAAVVGDSVGYAFGHKVGRNLFRKKESTLFHPDHLKKAEAFYEKYGKKTIIIARFIPLVRTFAPIVAGIARMDYPTFLIYNIIGGVLWAIGLPLAGYALGGLIPGSEKLLEPVIFGIIFISLLPTVIHVWKDKPLRDGILNKLKQLAGVKK